MALLLLAGLVLALATTAARLGGVPHIASEPNSPRVQLVGRSVHVVAPGDTLWTIARSVQRSGDVRPLVQAMAAGRHGAPLQVGEKIVLPAQEVLVAQR
jgi:nucleoid-associated protein YgaU